MSFKCGLRQIARHCNTKQAKIVWQGPQVDNKKLSDLFYVFVFASLMSVMPKLALNLTWAEGIEALSIKLA